MLLGVCSFLREVYCVRELIVTWQLSYLLACGLFGRIAFPLFRQDLIAPILH